jgi:outer membrane protein TolC
LATAEANYWSLALARESVKVAKDATERATELYKWYKYRANTGLTDRADLLQSEAALQQRNLDLKNAEDAEVLAARDFNASRDADSSTVAEKLVPMTSESLDQLKVPARAEMRDDTRAALEQSNVAQAADEQSRQTYKPTLELFGTAAMNNNNPLSTQEQSNAFNNSFSATRPTQIVGIRFSAPLDIGLVQEVRAGHKASMHAAALTYQRKLFDQEKGWHDLTEKFAQAKGKLAIYDQLEKTQKAKLDYEKLRKKQGRTTTQWVIQFETEYEQTQLARIQTMSEILQLLAQMKTYASSSTEIATR